MTDRELMQQALKALSKSDYFTWRTITPLIEALRARLAQPERQWQGLTDEEIADLWSAQIFHIVDLKLAKDFVRDIEDKLKEKNT